MRYISLLASLLIILSSCSVSPDTLSNKKVSPEVSPYPSTPLSASGTFTEPPAPKTTDSYSALGSKPTWSIEVNGTSATLNQPGSGGQITTNFTVAQDDKSAIIAIRSVKGDMFLTLVKSECTVESNTMKYHYSATLNVGAEVLRGCANKK